jgi:hypothetical protein
LIFTLPVDSEEDPIARFVKAAATWHFWVTHQSPLHHCWLQLVAVCLNIYSKLVWNTTFLQNTPVALLDFHP